MSERLRMMGDRSRSERSRQSCAVRVARAVYVYVGRVGGKFDHLGVVPVLRRGASPH